MIVSGYDYLETGLDSDALSSSESHSVFLTGSLRLTCNRVPGMTHRP
jgi:hypothetical protein